MAASGQYQKQLARVLSLAAVSWTAAFLFVALVPARRVPEALGAAVPGVGALLCHQRPERSFHANGRRFPVCARCTALYISGTLGALIGWAGAVRIPRHTRRMLIVAAVPTAVTIAIEWAGISGLSNPMRALAALPLGGVAGWLFVRMLRAEASASTCAMIA